MILSRKLSKMIDNSNNMQSRLGGGVGNITGLRERNINSGVTDRDVQYTQILILLIHRHSMVNIDLTGLMCMSLLSL